MTGYSSIAAAGPEEICARRDLAFALKTRTLYLDPLVWEWLCTAVGVRSADLRGVAGPTDDRVPPEALGGCVDVGDVVRGLREHLQLAR